MSGGWDHRPGAQLALLADPDRETARVARRLLLARGFELVHARAGLAALELFQRMPNSFALGLISLYLPDIPGAVLLETLRLFRPAMPVVCLRDRQLEHALDVKHCLTKPLLEPEFENQLAAALNGAGVAPGSSVTPEAVARARARYAISGDMVEAAREIALG